MHIHVHETCSRTCTCMCTTRVHDVYVTVCPLMPSLSLSQPCTRSLRELNLSYNRCGDNGLFMLKLGLLANRSLDKLNLCNVKMTDEGELLVVGSTERTNDGGAVTQFVCVHSMVFLRSFVP